MAWPAAVLGSATDMGLPALDSVDLARQSVPWVPLNILALPARPTFAAE